MLNGESLATSTEQSLPDVFWVFLKLDSKLVLFHSIFWPRKLAEVHSELVDISCRRLKLTIQPAPQSSAATSN